MPYVITGGEYESSIAYRATFCVLGMHSRRRSYTVSEKLKKLEIGQRVENMMSAKVIFATGEK